MPQGAPATNESLPSPQTAQTPTSPAAPAPARSRRSPSTEGRFGPAQAERLLWRAGFGPRPGEAAKLAKKGLTGRGPLAHPAAPKERLAGPRRHDGDGRPLAPADAWGHDHLWWLDRMVRTQPAARRADDARLARLVRDLERRRRLAAADARTRTSSSAATRSAPSPTCSSRSRATRRCCSGCRAPTTRKDAPNENYGRELMELFTLGAGRGYTEDDVREQARALTGWHERLEATASGRPTSASTRAPRHRASKTVFGKSGHFDWRDSCRLCVDAPDARVVLRREAVELLHPRRRPDATTRAGARASSTRERLRGPPGARGDPPPPAPLRRARAW